MMKRHACRLLSLLTALALVVSLMGGLAGSASAAGTIDFDLSVVGAEDPHHVYVNAGDTFYVTLTVHFPADAQSYVMKWMQDEILYDSGFFYTTRTRGTGNKIDVSFVQFLGMPMVKLSTMGVTLSGPDTAVASFAIRPKTTLANGTTTTLSNGSVLCYDGNDQRMTVTTRDLTVTIGPKPLPTSTVTYSTAGGTMAPTAFPETDAQYIDYEDETPYYAQTVVTGSSITLPAAPTREYHSFDGWYDGTNTYAPGAGVTVNDDLRFTALWTQWPLVTLVANGGAFEGETSAYVQPGTGLALPEATRDECDFLGWSDGTTTYTGTYIAGTESVSLVAQWQAWPTLTLDPGEGSADGETTYTRKPATAVALPGAARDGYDFLGWFLGGVGYTESYTLGSADVTLSARWAERHTLTLDPNGGSLSGASSFEGAAGAAVALPTPSKTNARFGGWSDGSSVYGGSVVMPDSDLTLTALWTDFPTLLLDPGEGTVSGARAFTQEAGTTVALPTAYRAGCTFLGWGPDRLTGTYTMGSASVTLSAQWQKYPTLTLDPDGGSLGAAPAAYTAAPGTEIALPQLTRVGYLFGGWEDDAKTYTDSFTLGDTDAALTAKWTACEHKHAEYAETGATEWTYREGEAKHTRTVYSAATCPDCGMALTKSEDQTAACSYEKGWSITATSHSHICTVCGGVADEAVHSYSGDTCTVCGFRNPVYSMPAPAPVELEPDVTVSGTVATIHALSSAALKAAADSGNPSDPIELDLSREAKTVDAVKLSAALAREIVALDTADGVKFIFTGGSFNLNDTALAQMAANGAGELTISLRVDELDALTETQRDAFGLSDARFVIFAAAEVDGKAVTSLNGGVATVELPCEPLEDPDAYFDVYHVSAAGALARTVSFQQKKTLTFLTDRLSDFVYVAGALVFPQPEIVFEDVEDGAYYADAVAWAVKAGVTVGVDDTHFAPTRACTRAQFVTFLWRAAGKPEPSSANPFTDVNETKHEAYYKAILWAVEQGITKGVNAEGTLFDPGASVTRGQAVTFMNRYAGGTGDGASSFDDVAAGQYYAAAVDWAVAHGITKGNSTTANTFGPNETCTRGQMVTFLFRMFIA